MRTPGFSLPGQLVPGDPRLEARGSAAPQTPINLQLQATALKFREFCSQVCFERVSSPFQSWGLSDCHSQEDFSCESPGCRGLGACFCDRRKWGPVTSWACRVLSSGLAEAPGEEGTVQCMSNRHPCL